MLRLLIVDDEILVRMGIKMSIDWNSIGFEVVGEADNGEKALEIARKTLPHVVLTDTRMPKMDGLELIKKLKEELPFTKVIVLSCYTDSEYVREAMQFGGALDYIPKLSMNPDDLKKTMEKVKDLINKESLKNDSQDLGSNPIADVDDKNDFFNEFLENSKLGEKWFFDNTDKLGLKFLNDCSYIAAVMSIDNYKTVEKRNISADKRQLNKVIVSTLDEAIKGTDLNGYSFYLTDSEFGLLINMSIKDREAIHSKIMNMCSGLQSKLQLYFNLSVTFGISSARADICDIRNAYKDACDAVEFRFYRGEGSIIFYEDIFLHNDKVYYDSEKEAHLRELLNNGKISDVKNTLIDTISQIEKDGNVLPSKILNEFSEIIYTFSSVIKKYGGDIKCIKDAGGNAAYESIFCCNNLNEIKSWFQWFIDRYGEELRNFKKKMYGVEISKAVEYINQNYKKDLKLSEVAGYVAMNETYFSHLFKRDTGYAFTDFLNTLRVEKAKDLLKTKNLSVYRVAEMVGYSSESYFSKVFKQTVGISPSEYKTKKKI